MKKTVDEKLSDALDIEHTMLSDSSRSTSVVSTQDQQTKVEPTDIVEDDYEYARNNLKGLIENGKEAMQNILFLAKEGESARTYEVVGQLIKTLAETNKDLLELAKKSKDLRGEKEEKAPTQIQNALFVGSTAELQKLLNNK